LVIGLTPALEDYLEGILILREKKNVVRVKDLANLLKVKASSVIEALRKLKELELIEQEKYGYIELTQKGINLASEIRKRHMILKNFLTDVLGVSEEIAEEDACKMEHHLSEETMQKLAKFVASYEPDRSSSPKLKSLDTLTIGARGKIIRVTGSGPLKRKLLDMGFTRGEVAQIEEIAPLGSPIKVLIKGTRVSLRKEEAKNVLVEVIED